jgi:hypothetical protein
MMKTSRVYIPQSHHIGLTRHTKGSISGKGTTPLLLDGGLGGGNSYVSVDEYVSTTGRNPMKVSGSGLAKSFTDKLAKLNIGKMPISRKPNNINFSL